MKKLKLILVPLLSALFGAALVFAFFKFKPESATYLIGAKSKAPSMQDNVDSIIQDQNKIFKNLDAFFNDDFFRQDDPFEEMRKFREQLGRQFRPKSDSFFSSPFDSWYEGKFGGGSVEDITKREDENYVYYDVKLAGVEGNTVKTNVENGYLTINGEVKKSQESGEGVNARSFYQSSFTRTFPLPENVVSEKMEMASEKNKLILKFPKRKPLTNGARERT